MATIILSIIFVLATALAGVTWHFEKRRIQRIEDAERAEAERIVMEARPTIAFSEVLTRSFVTDGPASNMDAIKRARSQGIEAGEAKCQRTHSKLRRTWFFFGVGIAAGVCGVLLILIR